MYYQRQVPHKKNYKPQSYYSQFVEGLVQLKQEVQHFNAKENHPSSINLPSKRTKKFALKKFTEPRYHKLVTEILEQKNKQNGNFQNIEKIYQTSAVRKGKVDISEDNAFLFLGEVQTENSNVRRNIRVKSKNLKNQKYLNLKENILRKRKILDREWEKTDIFRENHYISNHNTKNIGKKEVSIMKRVQMNRFCYSNNQTQRTQSALCTDTNELN